MWIVGGQARGARMLPGGAAGIDLRARLRVGLHRHEIKEKA